MQDLNSNLTPMMRQYIQTKKEYPDGVLLFRAGDFYEMFYDDAKIAAQILNITLTKRGKGTGEAPLAGIPYHSIDPYITKLIKAGKKVVICEQIEDPKLAKGLVKRAVTRIITPSTIFNNDYENNFLCSIVKAKKNYGFSIVDITTGDFKSGVIDSFDNLLDQLIIIKPKELIVTKNLLDDYKNIEKIKKHINNIIINYTINTDLQTSTEKLLTHFNLKSLESFGFEEDASIISAYNALNYLKETQFCDLNYIKTIKKFNKSKFLKLDRKTIKNLELVSNLKDDSIKNSLFSLINHTKTAMGYRKLYFDLLHPLTDKQKLKQIHDSVDEIRADLFLQEELKNNLSYIGDLDKIICKIGFGNANARDLISLKQSLEIIPLIKKTLLETKSENLRKLLEMPSLDTLTEKISQTIVKDPPFSLREGNFIKPSFSKELYDLINITKNSSSWLSEFEAKLKSETNIKSLKLKFNKIFGYYIEIPKSQANQVPKYFIRKQTLVNSERYTTEELSFKEQQILSAKDKRNELEFEIFTNLCKETLEYQEEIKVLSSLIAKLDVYFSHSFVSNNFDYVRPIIDDSDQLIFKDLRHPIIEKLTHFIPNDCDLSKTNKTMIITGPNMAGKSSYMRSVCVGVILGLSGCFVPASYAKIGEIDAVFTRVGASDDIIHGQSTFLVEMSEVAYILNNSTNNSLVILDEIGRGTSTYDGLSLAWAIVEELNNSVCSKTLVATHYHILNKLQELYTGINNFHVTAKEEGDSLHFFHKLQKGGINKSYGIQVAKLAGIKNSVINRALIIQRDLENDSFLKLKNNDNNTIDSQETEKPVIYDSEQKSLSEFNGE
jgi:DNA mismatch repair protein MutS